MIHVKCHTVLIQISLLAEMVLYHFVLLWIHSVHHTTVYVTFLFPDHAITLTRFAYCCYQ